jgi:hypothetical protein
MPIALDRLTSHQVVALCVGLVLLAPLRVATGTTSMPLLIGAVLFGLVIAALVGAALRPDRRRGGGVEGTAVATVFWAIALTGTWAAGTTSSPDAGSLVVGLPTVGLTAVLVNLLLRDDDVTSGQGAVTLLCTIVLGLTLAISGVQVHDGRERAVFTAAAARQLESLGIQPLLPELDGYSLADFSQHRGETSDLLDLDGYSLTFEDGDGQDFQVGIGSADEAPCRDGDEDCRDEGTFTVEDRGDARIVTVDRGRTRLHAWLDAGDTPSTSTIADALAAAQLVDWETVLRYQ